MVLPTLNVSPGEAVEVTDAIPWLAPPLVSSAVGSVQVAAAEHNPASAETENDAGTPLQTIPPSLWAATSSVLNAKTIKQLKKIKGKFERRSRKCIRETVLVHQKKRIPLTPVNSITRLRNTSGNLTELKVNIKNRIGALWKQKGI